MPLFIYYYYYLYSFHISILCTYFLRSCYISSATILSSIWAVARGNIKLAGVMVAIGIILGFYLVNCRWYEN
ncbi:hypothetical protein [Orientia tsutsugamushi]|uniref:hypothetical protein n=1 Tax=Orientia tsutsugamushi TaxID=784 RepID=UPI000D647EE8|nr:hypothetical protein [Orientia tsutsugamushi]